LVPVFNNPNAEQGKGKKHRRFETYSLLLIPTQIKHENHVNGKIFKNQKLTKERKSHCVEVHSKQESLNIIKDAMRK
jgi:hypothetical protein